MKKILFFLIIFLSSCSTTERFLPGFTPDFITKYFKEEVKPYGELPNFVKNTDIVAVWDKKLPGEINNEYSFLSMYKLDDRIFIPTDANNIHIVSSETGELKKTIDTELDIFSGIIADSDLLYFGSKQDTITAIKQSDHKVVWQRIMSSEVMSISEVANDTIYAITNDSKVTAIDINTGKFIWINSQIPSSLSIRGFSKPVISDDKLYVGFEDGRIVSYDSLNGDIIWQNQLKAINIETIIDRLNDIDSSMIIDNGILYVISYQGSLAAIDSFNGQVLWTNEASSIDGLAENDDNIFFVNDEGVLKAIDKYTGRQKWKQDQFFKRLIGTPIYYNDFILVCDIENYLHVFNSDSGITSGRIKIKNKIQSINVEYDSLYTLDNELNLKKYNINKIK